MASEDARYTTGSVVGADGGMANAFVSLDGNFPGTPAPTTPVVINQQDCIYAPRVVGARVGQTLQLKNNDETTHNLHALSMAGNDFNTSQPTKGMVFEYTLKAGEILHIKCDIHGWMNSYVGIVDHPYFAVSGADAVRGTWLERWTLLDFFLVLIIAMAVWRLFSWRWGVLALAAMAAVATTA